MYTFPLYAFNTAKFPEQIVVSGPAAKTDCVNIVTWTESILTHPCADVPITVYVVSTVGINGTPSVIPPFQT